MSVSKKAAIFLLLTFALSWSASIGGWAAGAATQPLGVWASLTLMMAGPALAALTCAVLFEKGRRIEALGLRLRPNWWWLFAYLIALALAALSLGATLLLSDRTLGDLGANVLLMAEQAGQDVSAARAISNLSALIVFQAVVLGAPINSIILTFTEELGWRGYLHGLWRSSGFWRASLATGAIWGVWHAPAIYLFGHNYPDHRVLGVGLFTIYCMLLSPLMTLVRDRGRSVFAAGILHGSINAVAGLTILSLSRQDFPWNGLVGIGGFIALAIAVVLVALVQRRPQVEAQPAGA
ncbi:MAG: CPBP family intramembrane glutamic endopeptidase [Vitreimonas sp.]